jgi:hypothetical protein
MAGKGPGARRHGGPGKGGAMAVRIVEYSDYL